MSIKREVRHARQLLSSMLPSFVIAEMAAEVSDSANDCSDGFTHLLQGRSNSLSCECVVVLFSDISGFTKLSAELTPIQLVAIMDHIYRQFDVLVSQFDLYKVHDVV